MITVENLSFSYTKDENEHKEYALNNISFNVNRNEWLSILGHNGSGKSTIAKILIGLLEPTSGVISFDDLILNEKTIPEIRKKVGIVFQNPDNQFVGYNVRYDIAFGLENHQIPREEMKELIDEFTKKVDMYDYLEREPQTLSGGQKQRVAIAGILAMNCEIIILDEATSMLDPEGVLEITALIQELHTKYNKTIITITHDLDLAAKSDRVLILKEGQIISEGSPEVVFKDRDLLKSSNLDMPFSLRMYDEVCKHDILNKDKELVETIWEFHSKK